MRALAAISAVAWLGGAATGARAETVPPPPGEPTDEPPDVAMLDVPAPPTLDALAAALPPIDDPPAPVRATGWEDRLTLSAGVAALYELSQWPAAVLFGRSATKTAPGVAVLFGVRYGLSRYFEVAAELGARFAWFGDIAPDTAPRAPQADDVALLSPYAAIGLSIRPDGRRFHVGVGIGVGGAFLLGAATELGGPLPPSGATAGVVGELRGEVGLLVGPRRDFDVAARFRLAGYPRVEGISTSAVALELAFTGPLFHGR